MLLILEILLAVKAFRNGWRWRVLWPFAGAFGVGVLVGAAGGPVEFHPAYLLTDVGLLIALGTMARRAPATASDDPAVAPYPVPALPEARSRRSPTPRREGVLDEPAA